MVPVLITCSFVSSHPEDGHYYYRQKHVEIKIHMYNQQMLAGNDVFSRTYIGRKL